MADQEQRRVESELEPDDKYHQRRDEEEEHRADVAEQIQAEGELAPADDDTSS